MPHHSRVETLIIGGGQAGLAMSHMLSQRGCPHLVVERGRIAERWRAERWDGLRFQFPNWWVRLPDFPFAHSEPHGFATSAEILKFICEYATHIAAPVRSGVEVTKLKRDTRGFVAETPDEQIEATNVVVATGPYQRPVRPRIAIDTPDVFQVHASRYRAPDQLPAGAVLIVGSGASGTQIAEELLRADRRVYLSVGRHRRMPRRYRGHDLMWWLTELGLDRTPVEKRGSETALPLITGAYGGHTIDFRDLAKQGIVLLGKVKSADGPVVTVAPDLADSLAYGDAAYRGFLNLVDEHVLRAGLEAPPEPQAHVLPGDPPTVTKPIDRLDLRETAITSVIWATGYDVDFSWIELPVVDESGQPIHRRGVTKEPGLYFLGLQWLSKMFSSSVSGVGEDAAVLADLIGATSSKHRARSLAHGESSLLQHFQGGSPCSSA